MKIASQPENGEFVNTTVFTTSKDAIMTMRLIKGSLGTIQGFVLMSDGTETSLYSKKEHKLADVLRMIMQMSTIISSDNVQKQLKQSFENLIINKTMDDCSIAMLVKKNKEFKGYTKMSNLQKSVLLKVDYRTSKKVLRRYDNILTFLLDRSTLPQIARVIHLKIKYTKRYLDKLCALNFIEKRGNSYRTILIMEVEDE